MISPEVLNVIDKHRQRYVNELLDFLTIPSVSTYSHHAGDIEKAAAWVLQQVQRLGFDARI